MVQEAEVCPKCGREKSRQMLGSVTQWLLDVDSCNCDRLKVAPEFNQEIQLCPACGLKVPSGRSGSMTQWIFSSSICKCQAPRLAGMVAGNLSSSEARTFAESEGAGADIEPEPDLELDPTRFPAERYRGIKVLGKGGSGFVYLCQDRLLNKKVAVKTLRQLTAEQLVSFQAEARANSKLNHPAILTLLDFGPTESGSPYMVLEYFESITLADYLEKQGPLSVIDAIHVFERVTSALATAHEQGIFHRDLKPSNILISTKLSNEPPEIRLIDFGVAEIQRNTMPTITVEGQNLAGTPSYMAPDTFLGRAYDARSEVYSLGCVLFECLSGVVLFSAESAMEVLNQHANKVPPRLSETHELSKRRTGRVDHEVDALVAKCLEKNPDLRYASMQELHDAIVQLPSSPVPQHVLSIAGAREDRKLNKGKLTLIAVPVLLIGTGAYLALTTQTSHDNTDKKHASTGENADGQSVKKKSSAAASSLSASEKDQLAYFENTVLGHKELEEASAAGDKEKQFMLGERYNFGQGVAQDQTCALYWYRKAAENGHVGAMNQTGYMYHYGLGTDDNYKEALKWYRKAASRNSAAAMGNIATMYQYGQGVKQDYGESIKWLRKAIALGDSDAQSNLGFAYRHGWGVEQNDEEAVRLFKLSAQQNNSTGIANLAAMYQLGRGVPQDVEKAIELYERASKMGDVYAMHDLAKLYEQGELVTRDYKKAAEFYASASALGHGPSTNGLGWLYKMGRGVPQDFEEAMRLFVMAEGQGNTAATCNIGLLYELGLGVPVNHKRAFEYYRESAEMGSPHGITNLGWAYEAGIGVKQNYKEAVRLYRQAAEQDYPRAMCSLGVMYRDGLGVPKDLKESVRLFRLSASFGFETASFNLGECYEKGIGVKQDMATALTWYESSAKRDFQPAIDRLNALRKVR